MSGAGGGSGKRTGCKASTAPRADLTPNCSRPSRPSTIPWRQRSTSTSPPTATTIVPWITTPAVHAPTVRTRIQLQRHRQRRERSATARHVPTMSYSNALDAQTPNIGPSIGGRSRPTRSAETCVSAPPAHVYWYRSSGLHNPLIRRWKPDWPLSRNGCDAPLGRGGWPCPRAPANNEPGQSIHRFLVLLHRHDD